MQDSGSSHIMKCVVKSPKNAEHQLGEGCSFRCASLQPLGCVMLSKEFQVMKRVITIPYGPKVTKVFSIWHIIKGWFFRQHGVTNLFWNRRNLTQPVT
jgi:hypothetical protein